VLTSVAAGALTIRGVSLGGVYTSLAVPELGVLFDIGMPARSLAMMDTWLISHGHADHIGAMAAALGIRGLHGKTTPPRVLAPAEIVDDLQASLAAMTRLQRFPLAINVVPMRPGDEVALRPDLEARAIRTFHPVPSLGYVLLRKVSKLKAEFVGLPGPHIAALRKSGVEISSTHYQSQLAYVTDTLVSVLDHSPELLQCPTLILECTFLDDRKSRDAARSGCHIHLDEIVERAPSLCDPALQHLVLMHFSQLYHPGEIDGILRRRMPAALYAKTIAFVPSGEWPG
jgi:ribonuclease Z